MSRIHWVTPSLLCESGGGGDGGEAACSETPSVLSHILRYVSFAEVGRICRSVLREPMHLCTCVSEKGGDGEAAFPPVQVKFIMNR
jgi:hypothetical protein